MHVVAWLNHEAIAQMNFTIFTPFNMLADVDLTC